MVKDGQTEKYTISLPLILNTVCTMLQKLSKCEVKDDFGDIW